MDQRSVRDILAGKTYFIRTFGCQMNQHDSERVSGLLDSYGCLMALDPEHADIVVFMTCCVREAADTRLYGQCNSCKSLPPSPSGKRVVAVGGCIAQRSAMARACSPTSITSMSSLVRIPSHMWQSSLPRRSLMASVISAPMSMRIRMP